MRPLNFVINSPNGHSRANVNLVLSTRYMDSHFRKNDRKGAFYKVSICNELCCYIEDINQKSAELLSLPSEEYQF